MANKWFVNTRLRLLIKGELLRSLVGANQTFDHVDSISETT